MLGKLFKHEWKAASRMLLLIHGCVLLFAVLTRIFLEVGGGIDIALSSDANNIVQVIAALLMMGIMLLIFCTAMFTYIYIGYRFYKNVFTTQGYLTNTLPVTPTQIIFSKGLVALLWMILDVIILIAAFPIIFADPSFFMALAEAWNHFLAIDIQIQSFVWIFLILVILSPFDLIAHMYFSVALGNLFAGHKILGAIVAYFGTQFIIQILSTVVLGVTGFALNPFISAQYGSMSSDAAAEAGLSIINSIMNPFMIVMLVFSLLCILLFFFVTKFIMTKKLNLE